MGSHLWNLFRVWSKVLDALIASMLHFFTNVYNVCGTIVSSSCDDFLGHAGCCTFYWEVGIEKFLPDSGIQIIE